MSVGAEPSEPEARQASMTGLALVLASVASVVAAGLLLWSQRGDAVFSDMVLAALAWCF